jgi:hypothetical protein
MSSCRLKQPRGSALRRVALTHRLAPADRNRLSGAEFLGLGTRWSIRESRCPSQTRAQSWSPVHPQASDAPLPKRSERAATRSRSSRGDEKASGARQEVQAAGGEALVLPLDVADADKVVAAADRVATDSANSPSSAVPGSFPAPVNGRCRACRTSSFMNSTRTAMKSSWSAYSQGAQTR